MKQMIVLLFGISIYCFAFLNWRSVVKLALVIVIIEGALRKWVFPQASDFIYFLKDFVLLGAYIKYYLSSEPKYPFRLDGLTWPMGMAFIWCLFQVFNPNLGSPIAGFLGLKYYFFYVPLMWMVPTLFDSQDEFYKFLRYYLLLVIPVALLAMVQFFSPQNSPINIYASGQEADATVGGMVRVTGTFSYIAGYSTYLTFCFSLLIPLLSIDQPPLWRLLTLIEAVLVAGTSFMTGARGLILFIVLFLVGYILLMGLINTDMTLRLSKKFILPITILSILVPRYFSSAITAFSRRAADSSPETFDDRALSAFTEPLQAFSYKGFEGYGTGSTHPAIFGLRRILNLPIGENPPPWEIETGRIVLELGLIGFIFWYWMRLSLIWSLWLVFLHLKTPFLKQIGLAAFLFQAINITNLLMVNHTFSVYYWFFSGMIFVLPLLEYKKLNFREDL